MKRNRFSLISFIILIFLLLLLPFLYVASQKVQQLITRASGIKANIVVDAAHTLEPIKPAWKSFAQGGEESKNMFTPVVGEMKNLQPTYIRIDHIYDHHPIVSRDGNGALQFNFAPLTDIVKSIQAMGAKPFIALSYMPSTIASGDITSAPRDWNEWALVVQKTIEHVSSKNGMNISDVYYEVWNEPDLFGNWKYYGEKNYLTLYTYSAQGAKRAQNTNAYKLGGPATTKLYKNWIIALAKHVTQNNLRFDFFSWHHYTLDPQEYATDVAEITSWLFPYPTLIAVPRVISEWGFDSEINAGYDGNFAAAHTVATIRQAINGYEQLFTFEVVDGPDPAGKKFWGRWGLLTHPSQGIQRKPRYTAFQLLNQLQGKRLFLSGEGTWVTGIAALNDQTIRVILSNYDKSGRNTEKVPLRIDSIPNGNYTLLTTYLGKKVQKTTLTITNGFFVTELSMTPSSVALIELIPAN